MGIDSLLAYEVLSEKEQHILMSEDFAGIMVNSLYPYTDHESDTALRHRIAESLTWGGMTETPAFDRLYLDRCYMLNVDIWARNLNAPERSKAGAPNCDSTDYAFFKSLQLVPVCK
jgi:hypothetical protein